jgi:hypothetical protein
LTPAASLNFNVKNPRKAQLEKLLEPTDKLVQTVQVEHLIKVYGYNPTVRGCSATDM